MSRKRDRQKTSIVQPPITKAALFTSPEFAGMSMAKIAELPVGEVGLRLGWSALTYLSDTVAAQYMGTTVGQANHELRKARNRQARLGSVEDTVANFERCPLAQNGKGRTTLTYKLMQGQAV